MLLEGKSRTYSTLCRPLPASHEVMTLRNVKEIWPEGVTTLGGHTDTECRDGKEAELS